MLDPNASISLFFPKSTDPKKILEFLNIIYPNLVFKIYKSEEKVYFVCDDVWGRLNAGILNLSRGQLGIGKVFEMICNGKMSSTHKYWKKILIIYKNFRFLA